VVHENWRDAIQGSTNESEHHSKDSTVFQHMEKLVAGVMA
jgi:hypothetical protein